MNLILFSAALWGAFAGWLWWTIRDYRRLIRIRDSMPQWTEDQL